MTDELFSQINERLQALGQQVSEERLKQLVEAQFATLTADREFVRKMRFGGGEGDARLMGSKFARYGLTASDIEFLHDLMEAAGASGQSKRGMSDDLRNAFKALSEAQYLTEAQVRAIDKAALDEMYPRIPKSEFSQGDLRILAAGGQWQDTRKYAQLMRAMDTAESGFGSQLVGAQYVAELWQGARTASRVFGLIETFDMQAATAYLPVEVDLPEMIFVAENTANNSAEYGTQKTGSQRVQVDAKKFLIHQMWSGELEEDSIIPFVPFLRRQAELSIAHHSDSLVLNGDTTNAGTGNINLDDADPADTKHYLAFDGIRHAGLVDNTANQLDIANAAITFANLRGVKGRMLDTARLMDWGHPNDANDLVMVADPETADRIATLDEVVKFKQMTNTPLLNGEVARFIGHPVLSSIAVSKTEADGKVSTTGGNNTRGQIVTFNRKGFVAGWRRRVKVETERLPGRDQNRIVYSLRMGFGRFTPTGAASGIEAADVMFNISLA